MPFTEAILAAALFTSAVTSAAGAQEGAVESGPRAVGDTVTYRVDLATLGTKEGKGQAHTTLMLTRTPQGVNVSSAAPAEQASAVEPYNQVRTALHDSDGHGRSVVQLLVAGQEVPVPVTFTSSEAPGGTSVVFTGQRDTRVKGVKAHVAVYLQAMVVQGRLANALARNALDASVPFRKIHIDQFWSLARLP